MTPSPRLDIPAAAKTLSKLAPSRLAMTEAVYERFR